MELYDLFMNFGGVGLLALIMYMQNSTLLKKLEKREAKDDVNRAEMLEKYQKREDDLRARYDDVINRLEAQRSEQVDDIKNLMQADAQKIEALNIRLDSLSSNVQELSARTGRLEGILEGLKASIKA
jgi:chromosome segregation ATPase